MIGQIARLREVAGYPNVSIRIIPRDAEWPIAPMHGFVLMDDRNVVVDLFNTSMLSRGRRIAGHYRLVFDALDGVATGDIETPPRRFREGLHPRAGRRRHRPVVTPPSRSVR